jgi:hypothetical protein
MHVATWRWPAERKVKTEMKCGRARAIDRIVRTVVFARRDSWARLDGIVRGLGSALAWGWA